MTDHDKQIAWFVAGLAMCAFALIYDVLTR